MCKFVFAFFCILNLVGISMPALAQESYPSVPIRMVIGFAPGGGADAQGRLLAQKLAALMRATVVVENKPGAGGNIAADLVVKSRPDGYTLLFNNTAVVASRAFGEKLSYDLFQDLAPVALFATAPWVLVVHSSVPANSVGEFIAYLRNNPGKLSYGSGGIGSAGHLSTELFLQTTGTQALHVPYQGSGPAMADTFAGRLQFNLLSPTVVVPLLQDNRLKVLAVSGLKRSALLPNVPTLSEASMPGFEIGSWAGVLAPSKTPRVIIRRLNSEIVKGLRESDLRSTLEKGGYAPLESTPEEYGAYLRKEVDRWTKVIKSANITPG